MVLFQESGSCCSDCESDCCNVQNNENDLKVNELCCDNKDCGRLTSVPEEPRSPLPQTSEVGNIIFFYIFQLFSVVFSLFFVPIIIENAIRT